MYLFVVTHTRYSKSKDQPVKFPNPARGQLNRKKQSFSVPVRAENLVSRDGLGSPVPRKPAPLHAQAESGAYLREFPEFRGGVYLFIASVVSF